jgi:hypothetical protein
MTSLAGTSSFCWLCVLAVVVAIYATLGPAGTLVAYLHERNLLQASYARLTTSRCFIAPQTKWSKDSPTQMAIPAGVQPGAWNRGTLSHAGHMTNATP